ncbi:MAG: ornithine cyclodeaminase family protein [Gemmatimonadetes bacterium]|nr:ornithine cyclodeaminase family protein [Gemmatimonadota bacterium]
MRVLSRSQVLDLLPMGDCIDAMREALVELARGRAVQPLRRATWLPDHRGVLGLMPGFLVDSGALGVKAITVFAHAPGSKHESHQGGVILFDPENGAPTGLVDAGAVTAIRTAAVTALATDLLARSEASTLTLLGSGTQARTHLEALRLVRPVDRVRVWSRSREHAEEFAAEQSERHGVTIEVLPDVAAAVAGGDIVCTATAAREAFFDRSLLAPGMHVNAIGASVPAFRELAVDVLSAVTLFTDRRESLENEAWEVIEARKQSAISAAYPVGEIGEVLTGVLPGRRSAEEVTLFRSLGLAVEDLAAARLVLKRAVERGVGVEVDLPG